MFVGSLVFLGHSTKNGHALLNRYNVGAVLAHGRPAKTCSFLLGPSNIYVLGQSIGQRCTTVEMCQHGASLATAE